MVSDLSSESLNVKKQLSDVIERLGRLKSPNARQTPGQAIADIQRRMTLFGGHIRELSAAQTALQEAVNLYNDITATGLKVKTENGLIEAVQAEHLALAGVAYLKAVVELLKAGSGSRGSHLVLADDGVEIHPDVKDPDTGNPLRFKPENPTLRNSILRITMDDSAEDLFACQTVPVRSAPRDRKAFEPAWTDYRHGKIYQ